MSVLPPVETLGVTRLLHVERTASTMDLAHGEASAGAPAGLLVLADAQDAGRGRGGNSWQSAPGAGVWLTLLERPQDPAVLQVLALRLGLVLASALQPFCDDCIGLKWPNDLYARDGKLAGILVEARWRDARAEWVAIGIGVNLHVDDAAQVATGVAHPMAGQVLRRATLRPGVLRADVLRAILPPLRAAAARGGLLDDAELRGWDARDVARGQQILRPLAGRIAGIASDGAMRVVTDAGEQMVHSGSVAFARQDWLMHALGPLATQGAC